MAIYRSPYDGYEASQWGQCTEKLVADHPLDTSEIVDVVFTSWRAIFESRLGGKFVIGEHIYPKPQIMGFLLHELIPLELGSRYPTLWRAEKMKLDKDIVYIPDTTKSIELKTSSHQSQIFGNRSYAQEQGDAAKNKNGYYLTVNFQKFADRGRPSITSIRFGWLDHTDWIGQKAETGQQARLRPESKRSKFLKLYPQNR